jgi:uncharacterized protein YcbK (DUF882 family)
MSDNLATPYFTVQELQCKGTGEFKCNPLFLCYLSVLRHKMGKPFVITSACRSPEHNKNVGGHPTSLHLTENDKWHSNGTMAVDISTNGWTLYERQKLIQLAMNDGWNVGIAKTFIHVDRGQDIGLTPRVWDY